MWENELPRRPIIIMISAKICLTWKYLGKLQRNKEISFPKMIQAKHKSAYNFSDILDL